jgi:hypothetical protein
MMVLMEVIRFRQWRTFSKEVVCAKDVTVMVSRAKSMYKGRNWRSCDS